MYKSKSGCIVKISTAMLGCSCYLVARMFCKSATVNCTFLISVFNIPGVTLPLKVNLTNNYAVMLVMFQYHTFLDIDRYNLPLKLYLKNCHSLIQLPSFLDSYSCNLLLVNQEFVCRCTILTRFVYSCMVVNMYDKCFDGLGTRFPDVVTRVNQSRIVFEVT